MKIFMVLLSCILCLVGCASGLDTSTLRQPSVASSFTLEKKFTFEEIRGMGAKYENTLLPGLYTAVREDDAGIYYAGPKEGFIMVINGRELVFSGGIWIPHVNKVKIFKAFHYIQETELVKELREQQGGNLGRLTEWEIERNKGRIDLWNAQQDADVIAAIGQTSNVRP